MEHTENVKNPAGAPSGLNVGLGSEPTYDELNRLWTAAIECEGIGGASAQARQELIAARQKKFTWIGGRECNLRIAIDRYIEHRNPAITFGVPNV